MQIFMYILCLSRLQKLLTIHLMLKKFIFFTILLATYMLPEHAGALTARSAASDYVSENTYNNLYPYMNNTMRTNLNPGTTPSQSSAPINVLTRTKTTNSTTTRNVVPRSASTTSSARSATTSGTTSANTARVASSGNTSTRNVSPRKTSTSTARSATSTTTARSGVPATTSARRVVARSGTTSSGVTQVASARSTNRYDGNTSTARQETSSIYNTTTTNNTSVSSARCMSDYTECMNDYCQREDTEYNRCYCSAKLAQIDAQYKPEIDRLIKEILTIKNTNYWTDAEMNEYWMEKIGQYTGTNSWENLDNALNIEWPDSDSQVRGQQAFAIGHSYCVQHLQNCAYMQTNLRDAYRSEIARDCATYESSLQRLKNAAESIVESYK